MSKGYINKLAIEDPTAPETAWPMGGNLKSSNGKISLKSFDIVF